MRPLEAAAAGINNMNAGVGTDALDELNRFTCPVVIGQGTAVPQHRPGQALELAESRATPTG